MNKQELLITGATGSLGKTLINEILTNYKPKGIRVFSRDELKQTELKKQLDKTFPKAPISFLIGDVKDLARIKLAMEDVDIVIHAAALKHVPVCEENPFEAVQTNVIGSQNVIAAALKNKVKKVMGVSTDKSVMATNLYGATKMVAEKLFIHSNIYSGGRNPKFSCCRYGNVIGSRGSAIPLFKKQVNETGVITLTDERMTRFWISLPNAAKFVLQAIQDMKGGEVFIPLMDSCRMIDVANIIGENNGTYEIKNIGIRPGEKLHEVLISEEESEFVELGEKYYKIVKTPCGRRHKPYSSKDCLIDSKEEIKKFLGL